VINPYKIKIEKIKNFKGIKFDSKVYMNECATVNSKGYLILKDSSNYIHLNSEKKQITVLSLFPNLFYIDNKANCLYRIKFHSLIKSFYKELIDDPTDYPNTVDETNSTCDNGISNGSSSIQYFTKLTDTDLPKLIIEWDHSVSEGPEFIRSFHGIKIINFDSLTCIFDDINTIDDLPSKSEEYTSSHRDITIKNDKLIIGNGEYLTIKEINKKDQIIKRIKLQENDKSFRYRRAGTYSLINDKFYLID